MIFRKLDSLRLLVSITMIVGMCQRAEAQFVRDTDVFLRIKHSIDQMWIVDTHEHLWSPEEYKEMPEDFFVRMLHYVNSDLISAGMSVKEFNRIQDTSVPFGERWALFKKFWKEMRFTGYGFALKTAVEDIYGLDINALTSSSAGELNNRIAAANTQGLYRRILKEKSKIEVCIIDVGKTDVNREFFVPVLRFDNYITARSRADLLSISEKTGIAIHSLKDMIHALETAFKLAVDEGIVGLKSGLAYSRRIYYPRPTETEAEAVFNKVLGAFMGSDTPSFNETLPYQNFMMHQICRLAAKYKLPFQIHTGLQTGSGNIITNSKPTDLVNLIMEYPEVNFAIFHGGYPYGRELGTIAKNFPNAFIDMCWMQIISPELSREFLSEWLETVPSNKIMAFGGDYRFPEGSYAHLKMAKEVVAVVLAEKVISGYITEKEANELARKLLRTNAIDLFKLPLEK